MQQPEIKGYRQLNAEEAELMNTIKLQAEVLGATIDKMDKLPNPVAQDDPRAQPVMIDKRWLSIARTQLQQGFMALTRSVARPTNF